MLNTQILNLETVTCCEDRVCVVARHFVISGIGLEQTYDTLLLLRFALRLRNCHFNIMYDRLVLRALTTRAEIVFSVDRAWCFFFFMHATAFKAATAPLLSRSRNPSALRWRRK